MMCTERLLVLLYECLEHWEIRGKEKRKETNVVRVSVGIAFKKKYTIGDGRLELKISSLKRSREAN